MITGDDFRVFMELSDEWEEVFGEELKEGPMIAPSIFPLLHECLRLKSQKPLKDWIKSEVDAGNVY